MVQTAYDNDTTELKGKRYAVLPEHFLHAETELNKTGVTRQLLWLEYKQQNPGGYNYSQYCYHFNEFLRHKEVVMHLEHAAGDGLFLPGVSRARLLCDGRDSGPLRRHLPLFINFLFDFK